MYGFMPFNIIMFTPFNSFLYHIPFFFCFCNFDQTSILLLTFRFFYNFILALAIKRFTVDQLFSIFFIPVPDFP